MTRVDINEAIRVYFKSTPNGGVHPSASAGRERIKARYGGDADAVQAEVDRALKSVFDVLPAFQSKSLDEIVAHTAERAHEVRPELQPDVCRAIGNFVSFDYR